MKCPRAVRAGGSIEQHMMVLVLDVVGKHNRPIVRRSLEEVVQPLPAVGEGARCIPRASLRPPSGSEVAILVESTCRGRSSDEYYGLIVKKSTNSATQPGWGPSRREIFHGTQRLRLSGMG